MMISRSRLSATGVTLVVVACLLTTIANAKPPSAIGRIVGAETAAEVVPAQVVLPTTANGILVVTRCRKCAPESLVSSASTRWLIGKDVVDVAAMRAHVAANPKVSLAVFYTSDRRELKRVHATAR